MKPQAIKQHYITEFVNSGMSQQEAEETFSKIKRYINVDGWLFRYEADNYLSHAYNYVYNSCDKGDNKIRLKSLDGIENNRGWTRIESEKDLPKSGDYDVSSFKLLYWTNNGLYEVKDYKKWKIHYDNLQITHYQLMAIQKPLPPIF